MMYLTDTFITFTLLLSLFYNMQQLFFSDFAYALKHFLMNFTIYFFLEIERYFCILFTHFLTDCLKDYCIFILFAIADEIVIEMQEYVSPFVGNSNHSSQFVKFKFGIDPKRQLKTNRFKLTGSLYIVNG